MPIPPELGAYVGPAAIPNEASLARRLVRSSIDLSHQGIPLGLALAASFDLLVSIRYYNGRNGIQRAGWLWCQASASDIFVYNNACPHCVFQDRYFYVQGNKPESGTIGPATSGALRDLLCEYFAETAAGAIRVHKGREPVDIGLTDEDGQCILFCEIKSGPLFVPPLVTPHGGNFRAQAGAMPMAGNHQLGSLADAHGIHLSLLVPTHNANGYWHWNLGAVDARGNEWADEALRRSIEDTPNVFRDYVNSWLALWDSYCAKDRDVRRFWMTNACGRPRNVGEGWPVDNRGSPDKTISDPKTSVGMDRTDDIKKSTFQMLDIGLALKNKDANGWTVLVGLLSNLHAARHHQEYLAPYEHIIWGTRGANDIRNLFDGIISFSQITANHEWVGNVFDWLPNGEG